MKRLHALPVLALLALTCPTQGEEKKAGHDKAAMRHVLLTPDAIKWGPAPPSLPAGAQVAVLSGDPKKAGLYVIRAKFPDGYVVPPHWHPHDENVTVLKGTLIMGMSEKLDEKGGRELPVGSYVRMPKGVPHYARAKGETVIQVHAMGPLVINYINPSDDPRKKKGP
jgi:quercetin dioxygenase-like cupin family protein